MSKSFSPGTIGPGSISTVTFTITNNTGALVTGLAFTDVLPAAVVIASPALVATDCDMANVSAPDGGATITLADGQLGNGQSCTVTVNVTSSMTRIHTNPAINLSSSAGSSMSLSSDLNVATDRPGFSKSFSPGSIALGENSTLTFLIDNTQNGSDVTMLSFSDNLPVGLEIANPSNALTTCNASSSPNLVGMPGSSTISMDNGSVDDGSTCTVSLDVLSTGMGTLNNISGDLTSTVAMTMLMSGKAMDDLFVQSPPPAFEKSFAADFAVSGQPTLLTFMIDNTGNSMSASSLSFETTYRSGWRWEACPNNLQLVAELLPRMKVRV